MDRLPCWTSVDEVKLEELTLKVDRRGSCNMPEMDFIIEKIQSEGAGETFPRKEN